MLAPPGPVLDVGCGEGALLDALHALGRSATGLERSSSRQDVRVGEVSDVGAGWAAIVFWHSLEHLERPAEALEAAIRQMRPGGVLIVAVPNSSSLQARVFGDAWFALDLPRHLVHLNSDALLKRLAELGARAQRISYLRGGQVVYGWLDGLVGLLPGGLDLYDAIRLPAARARSRGPLSRLAALAAAFVLLPFAVAAAGVEVALRRGGTVYVEARCP